MDIGECEVGTILENALTIIGFGIDRDNKCVDIFEAIFDIECDFE